MSPMRPERVVSELIIIKGVLVIGGRPNPPLIPRIAADSTIGAACPVVLPSDKSFCRGINRSKRY